jgi:Lar family restriction alleviation protein
VQQWIEEGPPLDQPHHVARFIADRAAQWGGDQELEACCKWLEDILVTGVGDLELLRANRRPKSLKPCPFCGTETVAVKKTGGSDERCGYNFRVHVKCSGCGAEIVRDSHQGAGGWCDDSGQAEMEAVGAWNHRA